MRRPDPRAAARGLTLIEVMVSLAILLVGILGVMKLQIVGITANQGARANGQAQELARELADALSRLDPTQDALLTPHVISAAPPADFGNPLDASGNLATTHWTDWDDAYLSSTTPGFPTLRVVGVQPDSSLENDPIDSSKPLYRRRWSIWQLQTSNQQSGVRLIAVSVVYHERTLTNTLVLTRYVQVPNSGASTVNASAFR
jgi:prepilin-type N-terminal cleavage/methylation domain-containing protein